MKKLSFFLMAMILCFAPALRAADVTETIAMKKFGGLSTSSYENVTKTGTSDKGTEMVAYAFNPTTGQVRGNKTAIAGASITSKDDSKNWSLYNTQAMPGAIKKITVTQTATGSNKFKNNLFVALGTTNQGAVTTVTGAQKNTTGTATEFTFEIDETQGYTYFKLLSNVKFTSGSVAGVVVTVTYAEAASNPDAVKYTVTANVNDPAMGTVSGAGEYEEGKTATLTANANAGYKFVNWSNGSTDNPLKITVTEDVEVTANFEVIPPMTCAEASAAANGATVVLNPFDVVAVVKGAGYIYIKDESGVALIYDFNLDDQLKAGDHVEGFVGTSSPYYGLPEIKPNVAFADLKVTPGTAPEPTLFTAAPTKADVNKYVKFENVTLTANATFTTSSATNATMVVNGTNVTLRNNFKLAATLSKDKAYNIVGFAAIYNSTIQVYFLSAEEYVAPAPCTFATPVKWTETIALEANADKWYLVDIAEAVAAEKDLTLSITNTSEEDVEVTIDSYSTCPADELDRILASTKTIKAGQTLEKDVNFVKYLQGLVDQVYLHVTTKGGAIEVKAETAKFNVTATAENGTVEGAGIYEQGAEATLTATAAEGYEFVNWTSGETVVSTENPYKFIVTADVALVANFKQAAPATETVYFINNKSWSKVNTYAWDPTQNAGWPGKAATKEAEQVAGYDVYSYTAKVGAHKNVIFNNGSSQTNDLKWTAGKYYWMGNAKNFAGATKEEAEAALAKPVEYESVYFVNAQGWAKVNIYTWTPEVGGWPGVAMTKEAEQLAGYDVYSYTVEKGTSFGGVIFNNGSGVQTGDLKWTAGKYYVKDAWYTKEEAEAKLAGPVTPPVITYVLMGVAGDWTTGIALTQNADNANEYVLLGQEIAEGDAVKVVTLTDGVATAWCGNVDEYSVAHSADDMGNIVLAPGKYDFYYKVAEDIIYIGGEAYKPEIEWIPMDLEIANLTTEVMEVEGAKYLQLMGRDDMNDADVILFLNNYADVDDDYEVNAESSYMTFGGMELTVLEGVMTQTSETDKGTIYTGTVRASVEEEGETMYVEFALTMYAAPATVLVLTDAIVAINEELGTLTFNVPTGEGEGYYAELAGYTAPGVHEGPQICLFMTPEAVAYTNYAETSVADGVITLKGEFVSPMGPKFDVTISGKLPVEEPVEMVGTVKRAVQNDDEVIVLTHEADGTAHIYRVTDGIAIAELSQEGVIAVDPENAGDYLAISDIAVTEDGKLVATNYMQTQSGDDYVDAGYKRGETRIYIWNDLAGDPAILFTSKMSSNWFRSKQGLTMAVKGTSDNMEIFMTGIHATKAWARASSYRVIDGVYVEPEVNHNDHYFFYDINDAIALETTVGTQYELNASPLGEMNWVLDAELINPTEIVESETNNVEIATSVALTEDLGKKYNGATYVTVGEQVLMVAPFATPEGKLTSVEILDITGGFDAPQYVDQLFIDEAVEATTAATAVKVVEGEEANVLLITLVADATIYSLEATLAKGDNWEVYEDEISNLVIDLDNLVLIGGPSANFQVDVYLPLGEYNMSEDSYQLTAESSIAVMGSDATFIDGYAYEVDAFTPSAKAVVHCEWNGMLLEFRLTMTAEPMEATVVVVENAVVEIEKYQIYGDMYDYALKMTGNWLNEEDGLTYPVLVEVPVYYPDAPEPSEIMSTVTVGGMGDNDPWLGFGEGTLTVTTVNNVVTATGIVQNPMAGVAIDITISGSITNVPDGVENITVTAKPVKMIQNGQLIIKKGDAQYNAQGATLK